MPKICDLIAGEGESGRGLGLLRVLPAAHRAGRQEFGGPVRAHEKASPALFCDMTWGAGGSTSELTMDLTLKMKAMGLEPNMHLTCTNVERKDVH